MMNGREKYATILLVDDKPANLLSLENLLEETGRRFVKASSGKEALKFTLSEDVDLIILDVQMPEMDGFEVAEILRSNKRTKDIPIIFASAEKKEHKFMMRGFDEGAVDYLYKPLDSELTKAKVAVLVKMQQQRKELLEKNQSLEKAAMLINNAADIIGIFDPVSLHFEEVNHAFSVILGYSRKEVIEHSIAGYLPADDLAKLHNLRNKPHQDRYSIELRMNAKDGTLKWLHWNIAIKNNKWFVNAMDVTRIKEVERVKNYVATVVKQSKDAIYIYDQEGSIISWNKGAEKIYGFREFEALNMKIWNIIPDYIQPDTQKLFNQILDGKKIEAQETKRITKMGKLVDVLFSASLITDMTDQKKSIAITEQDITQQKIYNDQIDRLNQELQRNLKQLEYTNKELESFSYSVSHDLRAPLRAILGNAQALEEDYGSEMNEDMKGLLTRVQKNGSKMSQQIEDLLNFSRLGKKEIERIEINMEKMVHDIIREMNESAPHKALFAITPLPPVMADQSLMSHVLSNLISNAIKYSSKKENPKIHIGAEQKNSEHIYYVKDNGAGFDMKYAGKLFSAFQRLHRQDEFEGTGIGLAIVSRIITRHGGRVWAEAKVDEGAAFYFTLPA